MRRAVILIAFIVSAGRLLAQQAAPPQVPAAPPLVFEPVRPIEPPAHPLSEADSARVTKFSFLVYGDTRSGAQGDGTVIHPVHSALMDRMLTVVKAREKGDFPVRFALQTGDAVLRGANGQMWNVSYSPIIERLTKGADVAYYLTVGNHDASPQAAGSPERQMGLHNTLSAMSKLIPAEGSPRRLNGYGAYAFGFGNVFVVAYDTTAAADPLQLAWVTNQLEKLDRTRFPHVFAFGHYPPYSSGPHGGAVLEPQTLAIRNTYMPLFRKHHVRLVLAGHEHFFEHWVERYADGGRAYRMDMLLTGGGGAPTYTYRAEPDMTAYLAAGASQNVQLEHPVKPGATIPDNPNHFLIVEVDGDTLSVEIVAPANPAYAPFAGKARISLND